MSSPNGFSLPLSPLQRAICRVVEGTPLGPELAIHPHVIEAFGGAEAVARLPLCCRPREVIILAAVRTFKSQMAAGNAIVASQTVNISHLRPGEVPRVAIISLTKDHAKATYDHCKGVLEASPVLSSLIESCTGESIFLRNEKGKLIEIRVIPLSEAGAAIVSRWLLGVVFDEAPRIKPEGVKSLNDTRTNAMGRLLPGAQVLTIGSPWSPVGPIPDLVREFHGRPSQRLVVIRGKGPQLNPAWWTDERCRSMRESDNPAEQCAYRTDVLGEFLDPETALIGSLELDAVTREGPATSPSSKLHYYVACIDPASRGNAFTLVLVTRLADGRRSVVLARQWIGSKAQPLKLGAVFQEIARILKPYRVDDVVSDQWSADANAELAAQAGLCLTVRAWTAERKVDLFESFRMRVATKQMDLCPDRQVRADLLNVRKRTTNIGFAIDLPQTSDGRHCDYAASLALSEGEHLDLPREPVNPDDEPENPHPRSFDNYERLEEEYGY